MIVMSMTMMVMSTMAFIIDTFNIYHEA
jgi:hypothetical protein